MTMADRTTSLRARVLDGDTRALARLLTYIENDHAIGREALDHLYPRSGNAHIVGVTGPPGGGKSTLVNELIRSYRAQEQRVAVIAVDPSSPLTGGAALGDRIRMLEWHDDPHVFIRSMASRHHGGGLAQQTIAVAHALDAAGFDPIFIETVGSGQDEVAIAQLAMTTLLVQVPGMGDSVQTLKAGALEVGDILVVTKADRPEANDLARDLRRLHTLSFEPQPAHDDHWQVPVVKTSATTGEGVDALVQHIQERWNWLKQGDRMTTRRREIVTAEMSARVQHELHRSIVASTGSGGQLTVLVDRVVAGDIAPHRAASTLVQRLLE